MTDAAPPLEPKLQSTPYDDPERVCAPKATEPQKPGLPEPKKTLDTEYVYAYVGGPVKLPKEASGPSSSPTTSVDVSKWSGAMLDRNYEALSARALKEPKSMTAGDRELLAGIEREVAARTVPPLSSKKEPKVELCKRDVLLPGLDRLHVQHHWIRTSTKEAGMHAITPGHLATAVRDHTGEGDRFESTCERVDHVDEDCVDKELELGRPLGLWTPWHQCQTFAAEVLDKCRSSAGAVD
jgi:hypothetical protein